MISMAPGSRPDATTIDTASPARPRSSYAASTVRYNSGCGIKRRVISSAMPKSPSEPTKSPTRSGPMPTPSMLSLPNCVSGPISQHHLHAEDVIAGHAIFQAVGAAAVEGDIAADCADGLARWVGRVV